MNDGFNKIKSHLDKQLEVLQLQLNESQRSVGKQLDEESYKKFTKLESHVCNVIDTKMPVLSKQDQLQITVDYLSENNQSSVEKYEMLKTCVDWIAVNDLPANKQKNKAVDIITHTSITEQRNIANDDIYKEQELLKQVINLMAEGSATPEKFRQLETLIDSLAESSVSHDYMDSTLKDQAKERLNELQKICIVMKDIDTRNSELEIKNKEMQVFVKGLKKSNRYNLDQIDKEIKKQQIIMKAVQNENNIYKMKLEKMKTEATENLNRNILQIIHKLLAEQIP